LEYTVATEVRRKWMLTSTDKTTDALVRMVEDVNPLTRQLLGVDAKLLQVLPFLNDRVRDWLFSVVL
jgi:hypothetical protein